MLIDPATSFSARAFGHLGRVLSRRRAERDLSELPDWLLRDIGLGRGEIASAVRGRRF